MNFFSLFMWITGLLPDTRRQFNIPPSYQDYQLLNSSLKNAGDSHQQQQQPPCYRENEKCVVTGSNMINMTFFNETKNEEDCRDMSRYG